MLSPYENILNAIPKEELESILKSMGYIKADKEEVIKAKPMTEDEKFIQYYTEKLKKKLHKTKKAPR